MIKRFAAIIVSVFMLLAWAGSLEDVREKTSSINSITSDFTQIRHARLLKKPQVASGIFYYESPGSFRWEYIHPARSVLLISEGSMVRFRHTGSGFVNDRSRSAPGLQIVMKEVLNWMKGCFDCNANFEAVFDKTGKRLIVIRPKTAASGVMIDRIEVMLSARPGVISSITMYENQTDYTELRFTNITVNRDISPSVFLKP